MNEESELSPKAKKVVMIVVGILVVPMLIGFILEFSGVDVNNYINQRLGKEEISKDTLISLEKEKPTVIELNKSIPSNFYNKQLYEWNNYWCHQQTLTIKEDRSFILRISSIGVNPEYLYIKGVLNNDKTITLDGSNTYQWSYDYKPTTIESKWDITIQNVRVGDDFIEQPHITLFSKGFNTIKGYEVVYESHFTLTNCHR